MEEGEQYSQYTMERNPRAYMSMRDYRNPPHMSAPPAYPQYASTSHPQPPQSISPVEQAIVSLGKLVGDFVGEQRTINAQWNQRIDTVESNLNQRLDGLQNDFKKKLDSLQYSISRLINQQHVHLEEESQEEECLSDTMVEEQCQQQLLLESSDIGATICPWEKNSPMLTEEGNGKEVVEEPQKLIFQPIPIDLDPSVTAQPKSSPLLEYILPTAQPTPGAPTGKVTSIALPVLQNFKKLVANVQAFSTTSKTMATTHTAWHSGWFGCWFGFGAPEPWHF